MSRANCHAVDPPSGAPLDDERAMISNEISFFSYGIPAAPRPGLKDTKCPALARLAINRHSCPPEKIAVAGPLRIARTLYVSPFLIRLENTCPNTRRADRVSSKQRKVVPAKQTGLNGNIPEMGRMPFPGPSPGPQITIGRLIGRREVEKSDYPGGSSCRKKVSVVFPLRVEGLTLCHKKSTTPSANVPGEL